MLKQHKLLAEATQKVAELVHEGKIVVMFGCRREGKSFLQRQIRELQKDHWNKDRDG